MGAVYTKSDALYFMTFIYMGVMLWGLYRVGSSRPGEFYSSPNQKGHLVWHDSKAESEGGSFLGGGNTTMNKIVPILYLAGLFIPLLFAKEYRGIPLLVTGGATALYSIFLAKNEGAFGSLWCYYSVIYAFVALLV